MAPFISKTTYLEFLECPKNTWLKLHKPELLELFELSDFEKAIVQQGNQIEGWAQKLFPDGIIIPNFGVEAVNATKAHLEQKTPVLFQPTLTLGKFLARHDILQYDEQSGAWNLYEIKSTSAVDENSKEIDHIEDASFQRIILKDCGIPINKIFIVHLNKEYVRGDELDTAQLFTIEDVTSAVLEREENTRVKMQRAEEALFQDDERALECLCIYKGRSAHCTTFKYSHTHVPDYSVHDLTRIGSSKKKLGALVEGGIFSLDDIPDDFKLSDNQHKQVLAHKINQPLTDAAAVTSELAGLQFPLYFFDYETYPAAIPIYKGYRPYQQVPFQFSLHRVDSIGSDPKHFEYLHEEATDPSLTIIGKLKEYIGPVGHVIVWHKSFERDRNRELAERHPEHKEFLEDLNNRLYDLEDIFKNRYYVHPGFKGRTSIKKVLPVLVPELSYKELEIQEGATAYQKWKEMVFGSLNITERQKIAENLKTYCGLDTYAMYTIWKFLIDNFSAKPEPQIPQAVEA